ncbi:Unknown protein sequence [Pseudomonas amygdali pv. sesami]|nr:Unknown protein sequence [Pseudomonas amygdali pv. sesami]
MTLKQRETQDDFQIAKQFTDSRLRNIHQLCGGVHIARLGQAIDHYQVFDL